MDLIKRRAIARPWRARVAPDGRRRQGEATRGVSPRPGDAVLVVERPARSAAPGRALREATLTDWVRAAGIGVHEYALSPQQDAPRSRLARVARSLLRAHDDALGDAPLVVVSGLAAPHMLLLARRLATRHPVVFDACDSWRLQVEAHLHGSGSVVRRTVAALPAATGWLISRLPSRLMATSYISARDAAADAGRRARGEVMVVGPSRRNDLARLRPVSFPLSRVVVLADGSSFHNRRGLLEFLPPLGRWAQAAGIAVELYGTHLPNGHLRVPGVDVKGWAPRLSDVYDGDTAVFVTNTAGSGLPNKVLEADTAGRPLIMHRSLGYVADQLTAGVTWFADATDIARAASDCVSGRLSRPGDPAPVGARGTDFPRPDASTYVRSREASREPSREQGPRHR